MDKPSTTTIVFITGAFVSHHIWNEWMTWFESKGYNCIAPPWPHKDGTAKELRDRRPNDTDLAGVRLQDVIDHHIDIIKALPTKPIVIGHSLGGLIVQLLVNKGLVAAGVAVHSVPPHGSITFEWSSIRSIWKPMGFLTSSKKTYLMSFSEWKYSIANGMTEQDQKAAYDKYAIPASKLVLRDALTKVTKVDFKKLHPPLLFISGTADNITPELMNYDNFLKYDKDHSMTDYKEFAGRNHLAPVLPTWLQEADYILNWIEIMNV